MSDGILPCVAASPRERIYHAQEGQRGGQGRGGGGDLLRSRGSRGGRVRLDALLQLLHLRLTGRQLLLKPVSFPPLRLQLCLQLLHLPLQSVLQQSAHPLTQVISLTHEMSSSHKARRTRNREPQAAPACAIEKGMQQHSRHLLLQGRLVPGCARVHQVCDVVPIERGVPALEALGRQLYQPLGHTVNPPFSRCHDCNAGAIMQKWRLRRRMALTLDASRGSVVPTLVWRSRL